MPFATFTVPAHLLHRAEAPVVVAFRGEYPADPANGLVRGFIDAATVRYGIAPRTPRWCMSCFQPSGFEAIRATAEALLRDNGVALDVPQTEAGEIVGRAIRIALAELAAGRITLPSLQKDAA